MPLLEAVQFWHWWALGGVLVTIEMLAPGVMFL
jgi:membrane protein implicated in regulation of membrane protease activity